MQTCCIECEGRTIAHRIHLAKRASERFVGLMGRKQLSQDEGMLLRPCSRIHTFHMRFAIDVLYLSESGHILRAVHSMQPNRLGPKVEGCRQVLEMQGGTVARNQIREGERVCVIPS